MATEVDLEANCRHLAEEHFARSTISAKFSTVRRLYQAAVWRGLRPDNPAEGLKPPREATEQAGSSSFPWRDSSACCAILARATRASAIGQSWRSWVSMACVAVTLEERYRCLTMT